MLLKLLKDYGEFKIGEKVDTKTDEDAQQLVDDGIAEKVEEPKDEKIDLKKVAAEIEANIKAELKEEAKKEPKIFAQPKQEGSGFKSMGEFAHCIKQGTTNEQLMGYCKSTGMNIAINADGGFLIPPEFSTALLTAMAEEGKLAPKCLNFPVNHSLELPFVNLTTQATSWTGGVTIYKPAEGVAKTTSLPQFAKCELHLHEMAAVVVVTDALLSDSPVVLETFLTTKVSTEFALTKDEDIVNGSGAGEALGILNAPATIGITKETGQPASTIVFENVLKMWSRLYNPSRGKAVWLINQDCMQQISTMSVAVGTGGAPVFVVNATTAIPQSLFGAPIIWSPHCQTLGTKGDIILADFSQFVTIAKAGEAMKTQTSIHLKFLENETAFKFVIRFDGQPWWASSVTPKHGSSTVSPFITLNARA